MGVIGIAGSNHASWNLFSNSLRGQIISPRVGFEFCGQGITLNQSAIFFFLFSFFRSFKFSLCFTVRSTRFFLRFLFTLSLVHKISLVKMAFSEYFLTILQGIEKNNIKPQSTRKQIDTVGMALDDRFRVAFASCVAGDY